MHPRRRLVEYLPLQGSMGNPVPSAPASQLTSLVLLSTLPALLPLGWHVPEPNCARLASQLFVTPPHEDRSQKSRGSSGDRKATHTPVLWRWTREFVTLAVDASKRPLARRKLDCPGVIQ